MKYTYEVKTAENGWIVNILENNFIIMQQPHHPQQVLTETERFWTNEEDAIAWAEETTHGFNNPIIESEATMTAREETEQIKEIEISATKARLASLLGLPVDQVELLLKSEE